MILHVRYTAREGGGLLKSGAIANLRSGIEAAQSVGSVRLFSIRHEFPMEWANFKSIQIGDATPVAELALTLREHYPFWSKGNVKAIERADLFVNTKKAVVISYKADGTGVKDASLGNRQQN